MCSYFKISIVYNILKNVQMSKTLLKLNLSCNHVNKGIPCASKFTIPKDSIRKYWTSIKLKPHEKSPNSACLVLMSKHSSDLELLSALFTEAQFFLFEWFDSLKPAFLSKHSRVLTSPNLGVSKVISISQLLLSISWIHI